VIAIVGLGNVGSQLVPLLARLRDVSRLILVDPGRYDPANLRTQNIRPPDVGRAKAAVQARVARQLNPSLEVRMFEAPVEDVPAGLLRSDVLISAPDSRRVRQHVNRLAWRLSIGEWIDVGVDGGDALVRVTRFHPAADGACLECAWGARDYAIVDEVFSCAGAVPCHRPTRRRRSARWRRRVRP
jgi:molybdopterin/thiamine biosynthesis adenylyltransferase